MNNTTTQTQTRTSVEPLAYSVEQAAEAIGVSQRHLEDNRDKWKVPYKRLGGRIVYPVEALRRWINGE